MFQAADIEAVEDHYLWARVLLLALGGAGRRVADGGENTRPLSS
jgi:hypothetical protein